MEAREPRSEAQPGISPDSAPAQSTPPTEHVREQPTAPVPPPPSVASVVAPSPLATANVSSRWSVGRRLLPWGPARMPGWMALLALAAAGFLIGWTGAAITARTRSTSTVPAVTTAAGGPGAGGAAARTGGGLPPAATDAPSDQPAGSTVAQPTVPTASAAIGVPTPLAAPTLATGAAQGLAGGGPAQPTVSLPAAAVPGATSAVPTAGVAPDSFAAPSSTASSGAAATSLPAVQAPPATPASIGNTPEAGVSNSLPTPLPISTALPVPTALPAPTSVSTGSVSNIAAPRAAPTAPAAPTQGTSAAGAPAGGLATSPLPTP
ncbi:MAG: hypothetical protein QOF51_1188 [Chloroflexota bacterium]|nr:hypothetical protein [Chloroflexota bacterium]